MGRNNKLVNGSYLIWHGGVFPLLQGVRLDYLVQTLILWQPCRGR